MADKAEIAALVEEKVKEQMKGLTEQMSLLMDMFKAQQQQQSSSSSQLEMVPPMRQGLRSDKAVEVDANETLPFENFIMIGTNAIAPNVTTPPMINTSQIPVAEPSNDESAKLLAKLDRRLREVEGSHHLPPIDFSIYAKVQVPEKFKMPDFEKYEGTSNPIQHIRMYQSLMYKYISNGPFMVQTFQASLKDAAMRWYIDFKINQMENWEEAANAFVKHFRFNLDITVSGEDLEQAEMKKGENLKRYATRWRNITSQLRPEPPERELMRLFVSTLPQAMRSRLVGTAAQSFDQLVIMGEDIEIAMKRGWLGDNSSASKRPPVKKEPTK
ncbi:uncharacterized protein LOC125312836 [Rhodamnia argentea]|uniref:Uncharacterized protein LOC125312836 n=1 Tax=Rhodamnia argentea TaxID=178133 RepID=A0ABM3GVM1_9MYRT|nr:uncharacterized protein LOC125312836 [Rhodamnia argentea]